MHLLTKLQALELVRERRHLFDIAERLNPFAGSAWTLHFIEQVADDTWTFVVPEHVGDGQSLMLLYRQREKPQRVSAVANYYSSLYSPLISSADTPAVRALAVATLVDQLMALRPRSAVLSMSPLDKGSADTASLRKALAGRGWYAKEYDCFGNWYLPCAGISFEAYMKSRDSQLRNTWTRKRRKFDSGSDGARLEIVREPDQVSRAMDAYDHVYAKSWKKPEPYATFVRGWAQICANNGWLRLGLAWLGDLPIAAQFWFTTHGRAYIFKLAYDEEFQRLSAGTVLSAHMFMHALDRDRVVEIDYLTGDDAYKQSWVTNRRQRVGIIACNPRTLHGLVACAQELAGGIVHRWRKRSRRTIAAAPVSTADGTTP